MTSNGDKDMSKKLFDDAIGEVPPSTVDVDAVIARGRRAARVRRAASPVLATVAAVAVLLGGVAVVVLQSDGGASGVAPTKPPSTTRTPPTSESQCAGVTPTAPPQPEESAVTEARLTAVLTDAVSSRLPGGATLTQNPLGKGPAGRQLGPLEFKHWYSEPKEWNDATGSGCHGGEDEYSAYASVQSPDGTGSVMVMVARAGGWAGGAEDLKCDSPEVSVDETSCHVSTTPNGDQVKTTGLGRGAAMKGSKSNQVFVLKPDQTVVFIESANMATSGKYPGPPDASKIPLGYEQLKQIALDPRVTMYPR